MAKAAKFTTRHRDNRMLYSPIQHGSYIWIALRLRSRMRWRRRAGVVNDFLVHHAPPRLCICRIFRLHAIHDFPLWSYGASKCWSIWVYTRLVKRVS